MMVENGMVEAGSRYDLRTGKSPDAPETASFEGTEATFGWVHSYETGSTVDGPGVRLMLFMSGCFLRCQYCHNPDTWHLKDGTRIELAHAVRRLGAFRVEPAKHGECLFVTCRGVEIARAGDRILRVQTARRQQKDAEDGE